jgi:hypothetical protein
VGTVRLAAHADADALDELDSGLADGPFDGTSGKSSDQYAIEHDDAAELSGGRARFGGKSDVIWESRVFEFDLWDLQQ